MSGYSFNSEALDDTFLARTLAFWGKRAQRLPLSQCPGRLKEMFLFPFAPGVFLLAR